MGYGRGARRSGNMTHDAEREADQGDENTALPDVGVLRQMRKAEHDGCQQNAREHAQGIDHDGLEETAKQEFFDHGAERYAEQRDADPAGRVVEQFVERCFDIGDVEQVSESDDYNSKPDADYDQV